MSALFLKDNQSFQVVQPAAVASSVAVSTQLALQSVQCAQMGFVSLSGKQEVAFKG